MRCRQCKYIWGINEMQAGSVGACGGINEKQTGSVGICGGIDEMQAV